MTTTPPRYTLQDVKQAANGHWDGILTALGIPAELLNKNKHQPCPSCGGKDRFRYTDNGGRGWWICNHCNPRGGSGFDLLVLVFGCSFEEALKRVAALLGMNGQRLENAPPFRLPEKPPTTSQQAEQDETKRLKLIKLWENCQHWQTQNVIAQYLRARGIHEPETLPFDDDALRFYPNLAYWHDGACLGRFPAMVGAFRAENGEFRGLHLTYFMMKQEQVFKAQLKDPKTGMMLDAKKHRAIYSGALSGAAIPLFKLPENGRLAVCEGIETASAIHYVSGLSVWACGAANRIAAFHLPENVSRLIVIADNDASGVSMTAAESLQTRYHKLLKGNIKIWQPHETDCDVLDILARETKGKTT